MQRARMAFSEIEENIKLLDKVYKRQKMNSRSELMREAIRLVLVKYGEEPFEILPIRKKHQCKRELDYLDFFEFRKTIPYLVCNLCGATFNGRSYAKIHRKKFCIPACRARPKSTKGELPVFKITKEMREAYDKMIEAKRKLSGILVGDSLKKALRKEYGEK